MSLFNRKFYAICLSETWVTELEFIDNFFPNYTNLHSIPQYKRGAGVVVHFRNVFNVLKEATLK